MNMGMRRPAMRIVLVPSNLSPSRTSLVERMALTRRFEAARPGTMRIDSGSAGSVSRAVSGVGTRRRIISAVDAQVRARHVAREVGGQEMHATRDFGGMCQAPHRDTRREVPQIARRIAAELGENVVHRSSVDLACAYRIDSNIVARMVQCHGTRDLNRRSLAGAV